MFSIVTSAFFSRERTIESPRGDLRFKVSDFLLALNWWKYQGSLSGWPGRRRRPGSPVVGFSILTTSAPSQARDSVQDGPASNWVKSTTLTPSRQSSSTPISAMVRSSRQIFREGASPPPSCDRPLPRRPLREDFRRDRHLVPPRPRRLSRDAPLALPRCQAARGQTTAAARRMDRPRAVEEVARCARL